MFPKLCHTQQHFVAMATPWFMPMYSHQETDGYKSGGLDIGTTTSFGGAVLGADYTVNNAFRFGATINVGGGSSKSNGNINATTNDFNYWGLGLCRLYR